MKELFVPYELALLAREKKCFINGLGYYYDNGQFEFDPVFFDRPNLILEGDDPTFVCFAPLYQQLIDWFREKHGIAVFINHWNKNFELTFDGKEWEACVDIIERQPGKLNYCESFKNYYEALTKAIEEAFKLI